MGKKKQIRWVEFSGYGWGASIGPFIDMDVYASDLEPGQYAWEVSFINKWGEHVSHLASGQSNSPTAAKRACMKAVRNFILDVQEWI